MTDLESLLLALFLFLVPLLIFFYFTNSSKLSTTPTLTNKFQPFKVLSKKVVGGVNSRTIIFLTLQCSVGDLPTGSHVKIQVPIGDNQFAQRSYTPTKFSLNTCELLIRVYKSGIVSPILSKIDPGDHINMMGPTGIHRYLSASSSFKCGAKRFDGITNIALISGGTGITPMLQIINAAMRTPASDSLKLRIKLLVYSQTPGDVMLESELREIEKNSLGLLSLTFLVSKMSESEIAINNNNNSYTEGSMRRQSGKDILSMLGWDETTSPSSSMVCLCGPDGFTDKAKTELKPLVSNVLTW